MESSPVVSSSSHPKGERMWRPLLIAVSFLTVSLLTQAPAWTQASKKLEEKAKGMDQGQKKSWEQVDEINKETDKTKARYQQSQQGNSRTTQKDVRPLKKTKVGTATASKKTAASKAAQPKKATKKK